MGAKSAKPKSLCQQCKEGTVSFFCLCSPRLFFLCAACIDPHELLCAGRHYVMPLPFLKQLKQSKCQLPRKTLGPRETAEGKSRNYAESEALKKSSQTIVWICKAELLLWSCSNKTIRTTLLTYPISPSAHHYCLAWMETTLFCSPCPHYIGDGQWDENLETICEIETNGAVYRLPDMLWTRAAFAACWHSTGKQMLVFGGKNYARNYERKCEALDWYSQSWRNLPEMEFARENFAACEYREYMYLCGGSIEPSIEVFDPFNSRFLPLLRTSFPEIEGSFIKAVVENDELIILCRNSLNRYEATEGPNLVLLSQIKHSTQIIYSHQTPVVDSVNGLLYYYYWQKGISCIELSGLDGVATAQTHIDRST